MVDYNALAIFVASCGSTIAMILYAIQKSRCTTISCGCVKCDRQMPVSNIEEQLENVAEVRASISTAQQSSEPIGFSARPSAGASVALRSDIPWCFRHSDGRATVQAKAERPTGRDILWNGPWWKYVWNICSSFVAFNTWKQLSRYQINMSATLQYLNMPKRRKQNKQNRKLVQEQMNRKKELDAFQKVNKPVIQTNKADDVNSFCVICWNSNKIIH